MDIDATRLTPKPPAAADGPWATLIKQRRATGRYPKDAPKLPDGGNRQVDFAAYLGVPQATLSSWETGQTRPSPSHQQAMIRLLHVSKDELWKLMHVTGGDAA